MKSRKQKQPSLQSSQAGFTIIESLLAIIIVTVLMVAIGPIIAMSVAARVQARRVERASEAARTYVDGIRTGVISATTLEVGPAFTATRGSTPFLDAADLPTSTNFPAQVDWVTPSNLYCVDLDQNRGCSKSSSKDLVIQAFRTKGDDPDQGYRLGVRVYRADAFRGGGTFKPKEQAALKGNLGDRLAPLVTLITDIPPKEKNLGTWCNRLRLRPATPRDPHC
jgi:prepilin-type N-terminal cleavage/methylation domain-containing protein